MIHFVGEEFARSVAIQTDDVARKEGKINEMIFDIFDTFVNVKRNVTHSFGRFIS